MITRTTGKTATGSTELALTGDDTSTVRQTGRTDRRLNLSSPTTGRAVVVEGIASDSDLPPCAGCGRCCHLVVELRPGDVVPEELVVEHDGARCMDQRGNGACVALDSATLLCTIYADRPQTCRDFTRGSSLCLRALGRS